jgi:hypothetical protein
LEKKCDQLEIITKLATSSFIVSVNITKTLCKIIIDMSLYLYCNSSLILFTKFADSIGSLIKHPTLILETLILMSHNIFHRL